MNAPNPENSLADFIDNLKKEAGKPEVLDPAVTATLPGIHDTLDLDVSSLTAMQPPQNSTIAKPVTTSASDPATAPVASSPVRATVSTDSPSPDLGQLAAASTSDELATPAGKRPLVHFGQAAPATKSKANRKLVLQLTPEQYQYFAHVATLPGLDGVALPDLALAILQAWREDYRPEIKRANAAFKA